MRIICAPEGHNFAGTTPGGLDIILYGANPNQASVGATIRHVIQHHKLKPAPRAWDLLSIALAVVATDMGVRRDESPDGWTRQLDLHVAVSDLAFWTTQHELLAQQLRFLTTDVWNVTFLEGGVLPEPERNPAYLDQNCAVLLSGGLDSLIGAIDLVGTDGKEPYAVSQVAQGDKQTQNSLASMIGGGLAHLQLNHNARCPGENERSQRARSFIFLAYGVLVATALARYHDGEDITLYVYENGFISLNPPLTGARLGSLSTRTTHPFFTRLFQQLLDAAGLRVKLENPYQFQTKGEMLQNCVDQAFMQKHAHTSTSCGRYARNHYKHCGLCLPCLVRRAAFHASGIPDKTDYVFTDLSRDDRKPSRYDDVRSAAMAVAAAKADGVLKWAGPALSSARLGNVAPYKNVVSRGLDELEVFMKKAGGM